MGFSFLREGSLELVMQNCFYQIFITRSVVGLDKKGLGWRGERLKILSWDFSRWYNNRSQELGRVPGTKTPKITTLSAAFVYVCVCIGKFTLQMRQIWLRVKYYHLITNYFLRYGRAYLPLIHNDWQSSRATQPNTTAHTHAHKHSHLPVWRQPVRRFWQLGQYVST